MVSVEEGPLSSFKSLGLSATLSKLTVRTNGSSLSTNQTKRLDLLAKISVSLVYDAEVPVVGLLGTPVTVNIRLEIVEANVQLIVTAEVPLAYRHPSEPS